MHGTDEPTISSVFEEDNASWGQVGVLGYCMDTVQDRKPMDPRGRGGHFDLQQLRLSDSFQLGQRRAKPFCPARRPVTASR